MSLYAEYVRERTDDEIIEQQNGFATYRFIGKDICYLVDIYVVPGMRLMGLATELAALVVGIAKSRGCTKLMGSVVPSAKGSTNSVKALLAYGMRVDSATQDFIIFMKEI